MERKKMMGKFAIRMGLPEMDALWRDLAAKDEAGTLDADEERLFMRLVKTLRVLADNPRYSGLNSHDIDALSDRYGVKVWQSYLENRKPAAGRLFWVYGPDRGDITVIGLEPHPDSSKSRAYDRVVLSAVPSKRAR